VFKIAHTRKMTYLVGWMDEKQRIVWRLTLTELLVQDYTNYAPANPRCSQ
jgi:hypothetical protein